MGHTAKACIILRRRDLITKMLARHYIATREKEVIADLLQWHNLSR